MAHTPGPWHCGHDGESAKLYGPDGDLVTEPAIECKTGDWLGFDRDANARLIAAAPKLLEALKAAEGTRRPGHYCKGCGIPIRIGPNPSDCTEFCRLARAAIAKAEGGNA